MRIPVRDAVATALTAVGGIVFLVGAGLGLSGHLGWFITSLITSIVLLIAAFIVGCYVPKSERNEDG